MNTRTFGGDPVPVSEIGLGCWQIGGDQWGTVSDADAMATLKAAYDSGVTFYDTADIYGLGRSESLVAEFVKEVQAKNLFVATKLGRWPTPGLPDNCKPEHVRHFTEESLKRLGVETLDLTQLHCVPLEELQKGEIFETLRQLKQEGKIQRFGASVESTAEAKACLSQPGLSSLQIIFNVFRQTPITAIFDEAMKKGVSIIVRLPLASGLLSGKYSHSTKFAPTDHRSYNRNGEKFNVGETFAGLGWENGLELVDKLRTLLPAGYTMPEMALRWILDFPAVTTIIPGARNPQQALTNAKPSKSKPLSEQTHEKLRRFYQEQVASLVRGPD
ncbi:aldo/keto reductase [Limnoglobus roseus]|uniref:Aldo/keto reductase n=1 Tax=Limnoglobus roseus TaxID=2598579 RepID=A0A5C1AC84_9BACT|nr:aldo/keto reductase [Limnoglobus roseus]QEL15793.1 aldo/keto reductase [Limnoglobus roseus]